MQLVRDTYNERISDIEAHFELIKNISDAAVNGGAKFPVNDGQYTITTQQQKILFSSTYLQLYNLVESTVNQLMDAVARHSMQGIGGDLARLSEKVRDQYLRHVLRTSDISLTPENRLANAIKLLQQALGMADVEIKIPRGGGGNWDLETIGNLNDRIGVVCILSQDIRAKLYRPFRDDNGPLRCIKVVRNNLGHGSISFAECGSGHSYSEFRTLIDIVKEYLEQLMDSYENYIDSQHYLLDEESA